MNISYNWLRTLAPGLSDSPDAIAATLAQCGAPVDEILPVGEPIASIVVARVEGVAKHPNADRLSLCEVDAGTGEILQVVCGAPNVKAGSYYPFAPVGAELPGGIKIKRSKIRGVESQGMLCSERELDLGRDHAGIMELQGEFTPGESFIGAVGLDDTRIVIDVTPNRPDLLSHLGVARELAEGGVAGVTLPPFPGQSGEVGSTLNLTRSDLSGATGGVRVFLDDSRGCLRYLGAVIRGVRIGPSPAWLSARLRAVGLRPINNVVDATNYILHELGQPLHAFDLDRLGGSEIRIRRASPGERIRTLDGEDRLLDEGMTVIADAANPVAVAGVMGGEDSEVTDRTTNVFLECALFDPGSTRRTRNALGLSTDASFRFERGVDPEGMELALRRAVDLIVAVAGGEVVSEGVDLYPAPAAARDVSIRAGHTSRLLGVSFTTTEIVELLHPLGFEQAGPADGDSVTLRVPGYRSYDVTREADLIEEVARRYGYDNFPTELRAFRPSSVANDPLSGLEDKLRSLMVGAGFLEARLSPFVPPADGDVGPVNPLSSAEGMLRRDLTPGLLRRVEANFAHGVRSVRLFEIGTVFAPGESPSDPPREKTRLALVMTGASRPVHWSGPERTFDLWDLKALMERLIDELSAELSLEVGAPQGGYLSEGRTWRIVDASGALIGWGGEVSPGAVDAPAWADDIFSAEITLAPDFAERVPPRFQPIPAYPAIERDAALLVPDELPAATVETAIRKAGGPLLERVFAFDLFRGGDVPEGNRSIGYRLRFRAPNRTLTDRDADRAMKRVLERLEEELGVRRRG